MPNNSKSQAKPQKTRKLTKKQREFVSKYVITENGLQSALSAYDIEAENKNGIAAVIASENLMKPYIKDAIEIKRTTLKQALLDNGVDEKKIATKVKVLLDAEKVVRTYIKGDLTSEITEEDHNAIDKGLKHATNIYGIADPERERSGNTYNFFFIPDLRKKVSDVEAQIKQAMIENV